VPPGVGEAFSPMMLFGRCAFFGDLLAFSLAFATTDGLGDDVNDASLFWLYWTWYITGSALVQLSDACIVEYFNTPLPTLPNSLM